MNYLKTTLPKQDLIEALQKVDQSGFCFVFYAGDITHYGILRDEALSQFEDALGSSFLAITHINPDEFYIKYSKGDVQTKGPNRPSKTILGNEGLI